MWQFYKEKKLLISILVIFLDGIIVYYIPSYMSKLNYFYPMLTISYLPFLCHSKKNSYLAIILLGIIYDLLYCNIFLYNAIVFLCLAIINKKIIKTFSNNLFLFIILAIINIIIYDTLTFMLVLITKYQVVTIIDLLYKLEHSLLLNIMSVFVFYFLFKKRILNT